MISRIEATRYRCFDKLDVSLGDFAVLVGANGSGKTTLLGIPCLLGEMLQERNIASSFLVAKDDHPPRAKALEELIFQQKGTNFILALEARLPDEVVTALLEGQSGAAREQRERWPKNIRYELRFEILNLRELHVQNEYLFLFADKDRPALLDDGGSEQRLNGEFPKQAWRFIVKREYGSDAEFRVETKLRAKSKQAAISPLQLALPRVQFEAKEDFPAARWLLDLLLEDTVFFDPNWQQMSNASPPGQPERLLASGSNIPWLALALKQQDKERFSSWKLHVSLALPQVVDIDVREREDDHHAYFIVTYNEGHQVSSSGLSDGTLRILSYTLLPYLLNPPRFLVLEEPENGIHPLAINAVMEGLSHMYDTQVLVSSHSTVVLAQNALGHLLVARLNDSGAAEVVSGHQHPRLVDWQGNVDLGSLFAAGVLG